MKLKTHYNVKYKISTGIKAETARTTLNLI
ncbi:DNA primase/helicase [Rhodobacteraceae phage LS06-2018-MD05]|nr:DNA primase/helicase [Rhodobacteraceae phage LS06-2018-MD05]